MTGLPALPPDRRARRPAAAAGGLLAALAALGGAWWWQAAAPQAEGAALFDGRRPLAARIQGHEERLPPAAARCSNCHAPAALRAAASAAGVATTSFGPVLDRSSLTRPAARRGGPPSRYDAQALCRALREGVDPASVTLSRTMPRYELSDADCRALWTHLSAWRLGLTAARTGPDR